MAANPLVREPIPLTREQAKKACTTGQANFCPVVSVVLGMHWFKRPGLEPTSKPLERTLNLAGF